MDVWLKLQGKEKSAFKADIIPEVSVHTPDLYLLTYKFNKSDYIFFDNDGGNIKTDNYSEYNLIKLQHIIYGHFFYENLKINVQIGFYIRQVGIIGLVPVLLFHDYKEPFFENPHSDILGENAQYLIIDLIDFNKTRNLIGQKELSLKEFIAEKLSRNIADEHGLTFYQETSLFSHVSERFEESDLMTVSGMKIFMEEQLKK